MADDSDLERTEEATSRRISQAREKGNVPHSRELSNFAGMMAGGVGLWLMGSNLAAGMLEVCRHWLTFNRATLSDPSLMWSGFMQTTLASLLLFAPLMALLIIVALAAPISVSGWLFSTEALQPNFGRLNPISGIARMFSLMSLVELTKAVLKSLLVGGVAYWILSGKLREIMALASEPVSGSIPHLLDMTIITFILITASMILIVALDVPYQLWQYYKNLRMTKEEIRQEHKETEGDPQIKARIRSMQRQAARKRMMAEVPKADVIVTNPTHYAVAISYREGEMRAPKVVAKGSYLLAQRIRELGEEHRVPIMEAPPLARALYRHAELDQEIPTALFAAVAEVLAYVYQLRNFRLGTGAEPQKPETLPVPEGMDFLEDAA